MPITWMQARNQDDGRLWLFAITEDTYQQCAGFRSWNVLRQTDVNGPWPSQWTYIPGGVYGPEVLMEDLGLLDVFFLDAGSAYRLAQQTRDSDVWVPDNPLGGVNLQQLAVGRNADGRLEVFALGGNSGLWHIWQTRRDASFGAWASLGGTALKQIAVGNNADGRLEVFALGGDRGLWHIWQETPNGLWGGWQSLGGTDLQRIWAARNSDGRLEVFVLGGNQQVYHIWQTSPNGAWGSWAAEPGVPLREIEVASNADGSLVVFGLATDWRVFSTQQAAPNASFVPWVDRGASVIQKIASGRNADGRLALFAQGGDGNIWYTEQTQPNAPATDWGNWSVLAGNPFQLPPPWPPFEPTNVKATAGNGSAQVSWTAPDCDGFSPLTSYRLNTYLAAGKQKQSIISTGSANVLSLGVQGLKNETDYYFTVQAFNKAGLHSGEATSNTITPMAPPQPQPFGFSSVLFYNCTAEGHTIHIWVNDLTAGTGWVEKASIENQWTEGGCGAAIGSPPTVIPLEDGHDYLIVTVDPDAEKCPGQNDPTLPDCTRTVGPYHGLAKGGPASVTVG